jgi:PAS domain S-box-containing protein
VGVPHLTDSALLGLLDYAPDAMFVVDQAGIIVMANSKAERTFGYQRDEIIGKRVEMLIAQAESNFPAQATCLQTVGRRNDGTQFSAEISVSTVETNVGSLQWATVRDHTEWNEVEAERDRVSAEAEDARLEAEADRVKAAGEKKVAERVRLEAEDDRVKAEEEKRVAEGVRLEAEADRVKAEEEKRVAEGVRLEAEADRVKAEEEKEVAERVRLEAEGEKEVAEEVRLVAERVRVKAEGEKEVAEEVRLVAERVRVKAEDAKEVAEEVRLEAEVQRVKAEGEKEEAEGEKKEATAERKRLEAQLNQSQRMESLGQLAGGVAHDFNNLLAVIMNYASFVAEELTSAAESPDGRKWEGPLKDIEQIQLAAERASLLTHQLLSFARREVVQPRALSLNSAITRLELILRRTIGEQVELAVSLGENLPMVMADPGQIEQIVLNLAINARDAMPTGGILSIDTSIREVDQGESFVGGPVAGIYACVRVSDTGGGMAPEVRDRAFEPFFTTKPRGEGSGLGLATVYGIVSQSGGYTRIYSDEGVGTAISILLPAAQQDATREELDRTAQSLNPLVGNETILVVDDEEALREVTRRILTRNGYTVVTASSGAAAIEIAKSFVGPIDLLLTDVIMPVMQGPTVAKEVKLLRPSIRVLYMSGHAQPVLEAEAVLGTEFQMVEKPFDQTMLLENVRKSLSVDDALEAPPQ